MSEKISLKEIDGMLDNQQVDNQADSNVTEEAPKETVTFSLADIDAMLDEGEKKPDYAVAKKASDALNGTGSVAKQPTAKTEQKVEQKNAEQQEQTQAQDKSGVIQAGESTTLYDPKAGMPVMAAQGKEGKRNPVIIVEHPNTYLESEIEGEEGKMVEINPRTGDMDENGNTIGGYTRTRYILPATEEVKSQSREGGLLIGTLPGTELKAIKVGWKFPGSNASKLANTQLYDNVGEFTDIFTQEAERLNGMDADQVVKEHNELAESLRAGSTYPSPGEYERLAAMGMYVHARDLGYNNLKEYLANPQDREYREAVYGSGEMRKIYENVEQNRGNGFDVGLFTNQARLNVQNSGMMADYDIAKAIGNLYTDDDKKMAYATALYKYRHNVVDNIDEEYRRLLGEPIKATFEEIEKEVNDTVGESTLLYSALKVADENQLSNIAHWVISKVIGADSDGMGYRDIMRTSLEKESYNYRGWYNSALGGITFVENALPAYGAGKAASLVMKMFGSGTASRIFASTLMGRMAQGAASGVINLPAYTYFNGILERFHDSHSSLGDVLGGFTDWNNIKAALGEAPTGAVLGPMALFFGRLGRAVGGGRKAVEKGASWFGEGLAFSGSSSIKKWMEINERQKKGEDVSFSVADVIGCTLESIGMMASMKLGNYAVGKVSGRENMLKNAKGERLETEGRTKSALQFESMGMNEIGEFLKNPRKYAKEHGITNETDMDQTALGKQYKEFLTQYQKGGVMGVDANAVGTAMWLIQGKAMMKPISYGSEIAEATGKDNKKEYVVYSLDELGNRIESRSFKNREKAEKWQEELRYDAEKYNMTKLEAIAEQRESEKITQKTFDTMFDEIANSIPSRLPNGEPDPKYVVPTRMDIANIIQNTMVAEMMLQNVRGIPIEEATKLREMVRHGRPFVDRYKQLMAENRAEAEARRNPENESMFQKILEKKPNKRSKEENEFLQGYSDMLRASGEVKPYVGVATLNGQQVYVKNQPVSGGDVYYEAEDGSVQVQPAIMFTDFRPMDAYLDPRREFLEQQSNLNREELKEIGQQLEAEETAKRQNRQQEIEEKKKNAPVIDVQQPEQTEPMERLTDNEFLNAHIDKLDDNTVRLALKIPKGSQRDDFIKRELIKKDAQVEVEFNNYTERKNAEANIENKDESTRFAAIMNIFGNEAFNPAAISSARKVMEQAMKIGNSQLHSPKEGALEALEKFWEGMGYEVTYSHINKYTGNLEYGIREKESQEPKGSPSTETLQFKPGENGVTDKPFHSYTLKSGKKVDWYVQTTEKDGVKVTRVVSAVGDKEVLVPAARFPFPKGYEIDKDYLPEGKVVGVKELRETADGAAATIIVEDEQGLTDYEVKLNKVEEQPKEMSAEEHRKVVDEEQKWLDEHQEADLAEREQHRQRKWASERALGLTDENNNVVEQTPTVEQPPKSATADVEKEVKQTPTPPTDVVPEVKAETDAEKITDADLIELTTITEEDLQEKGEGARRLRRDATRIAEASRDAAIAYSRGEIKDKPENFDYWKERLGLEEPKAENAMQPVEKSETMSPSTETAQGNGQGELAFGEETPEQREAREKQERVDKAASLRSRHAQLSEEIKQKQLEYRFMNDRKKQYQARKELEKLYDEIESVEQQLKETGEPMQVKRFERPAKKERTQHAARKAYDEMKKKYANDDEVMEILNNTDPQDIYEEIGIALGSSKLLFKSKGEGTSRKRGVADETGWKWSDVKGMFPIFDNEKGQSVQNWAETFWADLDEGTKNMYSSTDIANMMLDVLSGASTIGDLRNIVLGNRVRQAEELLEHREKEEEYWRDMERHEQEMKDAEEEAMLENIKDLAENLDWNEINGILADEYAKEEKLKENGDERKRSDSNSSQSERSGVGDGERKSETGRNDNTNDREDKNYSSVERPTGETGADSQENGRESRELDSQRVSQERAGLSAKEREIVNRVNAGINEAIDDLDAEIRDLEKKGDEEGAEVARLEKEMLENSREDMIDDALAGYEDLQGFKNGTRAERQAAERVEKSLADRKAKRMRELLEKLRDPNTSDAKRRAVVRQLADLGVDASGYLEGRNEKEQNAYKSFESFVQDSGITESVDDATKEKLQKIADRVLSSGSEKEVDEEYGFTTESRRIKTNLYASEKSLLSPFGNTVTWVDTKQQCVYSINYTPNPYRGGKGALLVKKEYLNNDNIETPVEGVHESKGRVELNYATLKDPVSREYLEQKMEEEDWSEEARKEFMQTLDDAADVVLEMGKRYKRLGDWNKMEILSETDEVDYNPRWRLMNRKGQWIPNRSAFKKNGEYPWNIDLGTLCTKRESFDALVQLIAEKGMAQNLGPTQIEAIKELLKDNDFLTACDICFNETKRARVISYANQISNNWRVVSEAIGVKDKMVGEPIALTQEQRNTLHRMAGRGYKSAFQELIPESERRQYKGEEKSGNEIDLGITASMMQRIAKQMLIDPTLVGKLKPETLITTEGMDWFLRTYGGHTDVNGILASAWGSGTPKPIEGFNLYDPLSWRDDYDQKKENPRWHEGLKSRPSINWLMNNGGFRAQSFTDYHPMLFLDYLQMFTDVGVRKLPIHIYTKVPALVKLFGGCGAKINMSLVPKMEDGVDAEHAGLKPDGKGGWEYAWDNDSFPIEEAFSLRQDPRFRGNVGIIAVGLSDAHILKMLDDPTIDQVIPYHKSGMPESVQIKTGLKNATDYTDQQTTGGKPKKAADFNFNEAVHRTGDPRKAASEYVKWCEMNGYTPKFEQFKEHPNYYKVLADFRLFDNEGKYSEQEAVNPGKILGDNWKQELEDSLNDKTMQEAVKTRVAGNEKLMKDVERLMSKQRMDGAVRDEMVKKLKGALGKDNVESLKQNEFFNALEDAYKQTIGAEQAKAKVEVLRTTNGVVYGFASGGKITLNENVFNAETPIHEFTHIWVKVAQRENAKLWKKGKDLLKQTDEWQEVMNDDLYADIRGDEDAVASEVLARIVGSEGADYVRRLLDPEHKPLKQGGVYNQIKEWLREMFNNVRSLFAPSIRNLTYDEFVNMPLKTLFDEAEAKRFLEAKTRLESEGRLEGDVENEGVELSVVKDPKEIERLEKEPVEYGYRNVSMKEDGTFRSPMADKLGKKGEKSRSTEPFKMNTWEMSDENPDLATDDGKINLIKPNGLGSVGAVDYNPYIHIRPTTLNKQFKNAWERNDLVYLKVAYPASELDKGYHAPKAKLSVGKHPWNGGELILSRWDKPMEIVPWEEVANEWVNEFKDRGVEFDIVPPKLLPILMERGVEILPPHKGMGKACNDAYQEKVVNRATRYEEMAKRYETASRNTERRDREYAEAVEKGDTKKAEQMVKDAAKDAGMATDESGKLIDLYHGTNRFGFTVFDRLKSRMGAFFTSNRSNVAANYGGDDHYAGKRKINKGYKQDDTQEGILNNARSVFDQDWNMATEKQKEAIVTKVEADARRIADEIDKRKTELPADDELDIFNATAWVEDLFYTVGYARENGNEGKALYRLVSDGVERYNENKQIVRDYYNKHYDELDAKQRSYLNYLTHWESGDVAIGIECSYKNILSGKELATVDGNTLITLDRLKEITDESHNIGSYHLYGNLGDNPLVVDADGKNWYTLEYEGRKFDTDTLAQYAKENGYTSLVVKNVYDYGDKADDYIFFDPEQIKSADPVTYDDNGNVIPLSERFNTKKQDIRYRLGDEKKPTFYSNAEKAVEGIKQNKATAEQWKAMLTKAGGIKAGEDKWMGLSQWLDENKGKSLTKDEVLQFVKDNSIEMEETTYSEAPQSFDSLKREYDQWLHDEGFDYAQEQLRERFGNNASIAFDDIGGELVIANEADAAALLGSNNIINQTRLDYTTEGLENKREIAFVLPGVEPYQEGDAIHFGPENQGKAVMWVRFGETTDADGNRVLVIDEIQSNRHQDAREKGYRNSDIQKEFETYRQQLEDKYFEGRRPINFFNLLKRVATPEEVERYKELSSGYNRSGVPNAPFEKNWHEVAMKRMLRLAAEEGFDKVAWTTGEQQAERYNLVRAFDSIEREDNPSIDGKRFVLSGRNMDTFVVNKEGNIEDSSFSEFNGKPLSDVVGKDLAERMMNLEDGDMLEGEDLRIGGEGMKGFYDQMLPRFMDKYGKKWGVKTGTVELPNVEEAGRRMHAVDVTPEMKESVMQGQPLFRKGFSRPRGEGHMEKVTEGVERANRQLGGNAKVVREADLGKDVPKNAQAWYDPNTGEVHVVAERVNGAEDASRAVWHEEIGHKAMSELLGDRYNEWLDDVHKLLGSEHADAMQRLREKYAKELEGKSEEAQNRLLADEWIAELAERGEKDLSTWQKVKGMFRNWLWKHFGVMLGDGDIDYMLHKALAERRKGYRSKAMMSIAERRRAEEGNAMAEQSRRYRLLDEENRAEAKSRARDLLEAERDELNDKKTQMEDALNRALTVRRGDPSAENLAMSPKQRRELAASIERLEKRIDALNDSLAETDLTDPERVVNRAWDHVGLATEAEMLMQKAESLMKTKDILRNAGVKSVENLTPEQRKEYDRYLWNGKIADARLTAMRDARPERPFEGSIDDNLGREPQYDDFRHPDLDRDDLSERDRSYLEGKANDDYARAKAAWNRQKEQLIEQLDDYEAECNDWRMRQRDYMREIVDAEKKLRADWQTDYWSAMENNQEADALLHVADMTGIPLTSKHDVQTYLRELRYEHVRRQQHAEGEDYKFIKEIESMVDKAVGTGSLANKVRKHGDRKQVMRDLIDMMEGTKEVTEGMKPIVKKIQQWFDDMFEWQVASGLVYAPWKYRQGYVPHLWNIDASRPDADAAAKIEKAGGLVPTRMNSPFMNERFYDTYEEGIQHGLVPKHESIIDLIKEYSKEVNKAVSNRQALDILRFVKAPIETEVWVEKEGGGKKKVKQTQWLPIVIDAGEVPPKGVQYNAYKNSAFYKDGTPQFLILSPRYVKGTERNIYSMFGEQGYVSSKDAADSNLEKALGTADKAGQTVKQTNLMFSAFHGIALTEHMLGSSRNPLRVIKQALYDTIIESVVTGKTLRMRKGDVAEDAMSHFVKLGNSYDFDKSMDVLTKLSDKINNPDNPEWRKFVNAKNDRERAKAAKALIRGTFGTPFKLLKLLKKGNDFILWDMLHDGYKLSVWDLRSRKLREKAKKKGWSEAELNRRLDDLGQTINDMFGGQHWELLNASPRTMRNLRLAFLSPDWNASWLRLWGRMLGMGKLRNDNFFRGLKNEEGKLQIPISGKAIKKAWKENNAQGLAFTVMLVSGIMAHIGYSLMNLAMRKKDIEEELAKAEEIRKTDPNYKSPYEEEGITPITWENFLGRANEWILSPWNSLSDPGRGTYVYVGRDANGVSRYIRPGKQMRELFELFLDSEDHLDLGAWYKAGMRKANPFAQLIHEAGTGYSLTGWENKELTQTYGGERELNRLKYIILHSVLPMSIVDPIEKGDAEKMGWRMAYPVSKGMTWYRGNKLLEEAIANDDSEMVERIRRSFVLNGMGEDFKQAYTSSLSKVRRKVAKAEDYENKTPDELFKMAAKSNDPKMRKKYVDKATEKLESTEEKEGKTAREAMEEYQQKAQKEGNYLLHCTAQDMEYDTHMKIFMKKAEEDGSVVATFRKMGGTIPKKTQVKKGKKVVDSRIEWKGKDGYTNADCEKFYKEHEDELIAYYRMNMFREGYNARIKEMKDLKGKEADAKMKEIREYRNKWMQYASEYLDTTTWKVKKHKK